uniref:Uncharacterized protein n=1 Tax=Anguilla anguilla TaxID=7936 RepID=A0A0E9Q368_ANGAN
MHRLNTHRLASYIFIASVYLGLICLQLSLSRQSLLPASALAFFGTNELKKRNKHLLPCFRVAMEFQDPRRERSGNLYASECVARAPLHRQDR